MVSEKQVLFYTGFLLSVVLLAIAWYYPQTDFLLKSAVYFTDINGFQTKGVTFNVAGFGRVVRRYWLVNNGSVPVRLVYSASPELLNWTLDSDMGLNGSAVLPAGEQSYLLVECVNPTKDLRRGFVDVTVMDVERRISYVSGYSMTQQLDAAKSWLAMPFVFIVSGYVIYRCKEWMEE